MGMLQPLMLALCAQGGAGEELALVERTCLACHREGGAAPVSFADGAALMRAAATARKALEVGNMPPWLPEQSTEGFHGIPSLTGAERQLLIEWFGKGAPGAEEWRAPDSGPGQPAATIRFGVGWETPAEFDISSFRTFVEAAPAGFPPLVRGVRLKPAEPGSLDAVMLNFDTEGIARALDQRDGAIGTLYHGDIGSRPVGALGSIGAAPEFTLPEGFAIAVPTGADIVAEAHSRPLGRVADGRFDISFLPAPAGSRLLEAYAVGGASGGQPLKREGLRVTATSDMLDAPLDLLCILPNPGIRCESFALSMRHADGTEAELLSIPRYLVWADRMYTLREPIRLEPGDRLTVTCEHQDAYAASHSHATATILAAQPRVPQAPSEAIASPTPQEDAPSFADPVPMATISPPGAPPFLLGRDEVSVAEFRRILGRAPTVADPYDTRDAPLHELFQEPTAPKAEAAAAEAPCTSVSWYDAIEYCNALSVAAGLGPCYRMELVERSSDGSIIGAVVTRVGSAGYRLPSEAEWTAAAAGTLASTDPAGIWNAPHGASAPRAADAGPLLGCGIRNILGNAWEWCEDGYRPVAAEGPVAAPATNRGRVVKGGSFADLDAACTPLSRAGLPPATRGPQFGFRVARSIPGDSAVPAAGAVAR